MRDSHCMSAGVNCDKTVDVNDVKSHITRRALTLEFQVTDSTSELCSTGLIKMTSVIKANFRPIEEAVEVGVETRNYKT